MPDAVAAPSPVRAGPLHKGGCPTSLAFLFPGATKDMGKMLGGDEEKDPDAAKKEEERQEALRQEEEERKAKYAKMEAEREAMRQGIRDKVGTGPTSGAVVSSSGAESRESLLASSCPSRFARLLGTDLSTQELWGKLDNGGHLCASATGAHQGLEGRLVLPSLVGGSQAP